MTPTRAEKKMTISNPQTVRPKLAWEYRGEGLYIYWHNPFRGGEKEDVLMFLWPSHDVGVTLDVEKIYEKYAELFCEAANR